MTVSDTAWQSCLTLGGIWCRIAENENYDMMLKKLGKRLGVLLVLSMIVAVCAGVVSADDWLTYQHNEQRNAYLTDEVGPQTNFILWEIDVPVKQASIESPVIKDGKIYFSTYSGFNYPNVFCYNLTTKKQEWNQTLGQAGGRSGLIITDKYLYAGSQEHNSNGQGKLYCLNPTTGEIINKTDNIATFPYSGLTSTAVVTESGVWIFGLSKTPETILYYYSHDLSELKKKIVLEHPTGTLYTSPSLSPDESVLYITDDGGIGAYSTSNGERLWHNNQTNTPFAGSSYESTTPVYADGNIYYTAYKWDGTKLISINAETGAQNWNITYKNGVTMSTLVVVGDEIIVGTSQGISAFSTKDGEFLWSHAGKTCTSNSPIVIGDTIYYCSNSYYIYAVDLNTHDTVWDYKTPNIIEGAPAYADGVLYVGGYNKLYAFADAESLDLGLVTITNPDADKVYYVHDTIQFDSTSQNNVADEVNVSTLVWDFGDDTTEDGKFVSHVFKKSGKFTVKLSGFTNNNLPVEDKITITVANRKSVISELILIGDDITISNPISLRIGDVNTNIIYPTGHLIATVKDQFGDIVADAVLKWNSDNETVLKVNQAGIYTTYAAGTANVTVSSVDNKSLTKTVQFVVTQAEDTCRISVIPNEIILTEGDSIQLSAVVVSQYGNVSDDTISWFSSNTAVVTVDQTSGNVTAVGTGTAKITASSGSTTSATNITVEKLIPTSIQIHGPTTATLGDSGTFTATVLDQKEQVISVPVEWKSSSTSNVVIDKTTGVWYAKRGTGSATIIATINGYSNVKNTTKVTLSNKQTSSCLDKLITLNFGNVYIAVAFNNTNGIIPDAKYEWTVNNVQQSATSSIYKLSTDSAPTTVSVNVTVGGNTVQHVYQLTKLLFGLTTPSIVDTSVIDTSSEETPVVDEPVVDPSSEETPIVDEPVVDPSSEETPVVDEPVVDSSSEDTSVVDEPVVDSSSEDTSVVDEPVVDSSSEETPVVDEPVVDSSSEDTPVVSDSDDNSEVTDA